MYDFEVAKDKVLMGAERKTMLLTDDEKRDTAYHEAGHVLGSPRCRNHSDPLHKVTIIPRGMALGVTMQLPEDDKHTYTKEYLESRIAVMMGGRCAEEIFMNRQTTGATGNDIVRATELARKMVCEYGMSDLWPPDLRQEGARRSSSVATSHRPATTPTTPPSRSTSPCASSSTTATARSQDPRGHQRQTSCTACQPPCWSARPPTRSRSTSIIAGKERRSSWSAARAGRVIGPSDGQKIVVADLGRKPNFGDTQPSPKVTQHNRT